MMNFRNLLLPLCMLLITGSAAAEVKIGIIGGRTEYNLRLEEKDSIEIDFSSRSGIAAGAVIDFGLSRYFDLCLQPTYLSKGADSEYHDLEMGIIKSTLTMNYIEVPVLLRLSINKGGINPYIVGGATASYLLDATVEYGDEYLEYGFEKERDAKDDFSTTDYGYCYGAGLSVPLGNATLFAEGRFAEGLANINDVAGSNVEIMTEGWLLMAGICFDLGAGGGTGNGDDQGEDPGDVGDSDKDTCDSYESYERPSTSLYDFGDKLGGQKKKLADMLKNAEEMLVRHLVICKDEWDLNATLKWHSERERLAQLILQIERLFVLSFTGTGFNDEENKILEEAYANSAELKREVKEEERLYKEYLKALKEFEDRKWLYTYPDASTRLLILALVEKVEKANDKWTEKSMEVHEMRETQEEGKKTAYKAREDRGFREMKEEYGVKFDFAEDGEYHTKKQLISTSEAVKDLLGPEGKKIYDRENEKRLETYPRRNQ